MCREAIVYPLIVLQFNDSENCFCNSLTKLRYRLTFVVRQSNNRAWLIFQKDRMSSANLNLKFERPRSLAISVAHTIEEVIVRGELEPGESIVENRFCDQLNVSRGTLREALRLLQDRNLVEMIPHRGAIVSSLTAKKAYEIYSLRMLLEPYAVCLSMQQEAYTQDALDELKQSLDRMFELAHEGNLIELIEADMEFHRVLCYHCDHEMLLATLEDLRLQMRRFMVFTKIYRTDLESEAETHKPIYDALLAGDIDNAEQVVRDHIRVAGEALVQKVNDLEARNTNTSGE